jgi:signal transduction histidine kinase
VTPAPPPSIRRRLSRALVLVSVAWSLAVSTVVWLVVRHEVDEIMDDTLSESAEVLYGVLQVTGRAVPQAPAEPLPAPDHEEHLVWQLLAADGQVQLRSHRAPRQPLQAGLRRGFATVDDAWRVHAMPLPGGQGVLQVAQPVGDRLEARLEAAQYTAGAALLVGLGCALWLSLRVRRELQPLSMMSQAVAAYDPLDPQARLAAPKRAELQPMHAAIVALGTRLGHRVRSERAFASHAAHALRTPLAGLVAQLAVAQHQSPPVAQPTLLLARQAADRLRRVVNALLALFRAGHEVDRQAVNLDRLVQQLPLDGLTVTVAAKAPIAADPDLLAAALANLLDNALRHGAHQVQVDAGTQGGQVVIALHDDGPGIAADQAEALQRALDSQQYDVGGTGLGLMLADLVARAHGGRLRLVDVAAGFRVEMRLAAPPDAP